MKQAHSEDLFKLLDKFVQEFLIDGNSILSIHKSILKDETISNCLTCFVDNFDEGNESFDEKIVKQFSTSGLETKLVFAHAEWLWAYSVQDISIDKKKHYTIRTTGLPLSEISNDVYPKGFGSAGQWHTNNKYHEISFTLRLIQFLRKKIEAKEISTVEQIKSWIEQICLYHKYETEDSNFPLTKEFKESLPETKLAITNILTYDTAPDKYERIASDKHKHWIVSAFSGLLSEEERNNEDLNTDEKIYLIRQKLGALTKVDFDFYEEDYKQIWNYSLSEEGFSEVQGLQYKKAVILYGPPGTSKTFTAKYLAKALITHQFLRDKENVVKYFKKQVDYFKGKIHHLQLHPNYTYEDFIAGYQLKAGETTKTPGILFRICEAASKDLGATVLDDKPHVLILDEINRIDLSRLFGEVFSALENRDEPIEVGIGELMLTIPRNLYVIGTMNEIDFSLERIDFALRRRFLWFFYGYNENTLRNMIESKDELLNTRLKKEGGIERFILNATAMNKKISSIAELGQQYQIGHTFFAEIVMIYRSYKELGGYKSLQNQIYRNGGPSSILWDISIEPMIISFLGNLDTGSRDKILNEIKSIYNQK